MGNMGGRSGNSDGYGNVGAQGGPLWHPRMPMQPAQRPEEPVRWSDLDLEGDTGVADYSAGDDEWQEVQGRAGRGGRAGRVTRGAFAPSSFGNRGRGRGGLAGMGLTGNSHGHAQRERGFAPAPWW